MWNRLKLRIMIRLGSLINNLFIVRSVHFGRPWLIPIIDGAGIDLALGDTTEGWVYNSLKTIHERNKIDVFLDVGVNLGQTLIKIKNITPDVQYYGFEPNPACVYYVDYLMRINKLTNTHLSCLALGHINDYIDLHFKGMQDTRATLLANEDIVKELVLKKKVPVVPFDDLNLMFDVSQTFVMKIDVEGYELEVFKGATKFIDKYNPICVFEVLPDHAESNKIIRNNELYYFLKAKNYNLFLISQGTGFVEINQPFNNAESNTQTDYLAIPKAAVELYSQLKVERP